MCKADCSLMRLTSFVAFMGISVHSLAADSPVDFDTQIVPLLTRFGCNSGACHGSAAGRGDFRLSLYGSNPGFDFDSIVRQTNGRRVNIANPEESLVWLKPTQSLSHGGGTRFDMDSSVASLLQKWIRDGAQRSRSITLTDFKVAPASQRLQSVGKKLQFTGTAVFSDGSKRDVTDWTVFKSDDDAAVNVSASGQATALRRGRHIVTARFLDRVVACEVLVPFNDTAVEAPPLSKQTFIDRLIDERLAELNLPKSGPASDSVFLRRVTLDLTGRLPTSEAVLKHQGKPLDRGQLIDRLLRSQAFVDYWAHWLTQLLRNRTQPGSDVAARTWHAWLKEQIQSRTPIDRVFHELLTASGDTHEVGPASFYLAAKDARGQAEYTSEVLLGVRLRCANCHDHPLDRWTQDDYHGLAAIFAKVRRGKVISIAGSGEVSHPATGQAAVPRIPGVRFLDPSQDGRSALADWLTAKDNPYFAKAFVNRLWKMVMGRGLVEPTDDLRATNPATHPRLLSLLARDFVENGYDIRHTLMLICSSQAYGRSSGPLAENQDDDRFLSHAIEHRLSPAVLADAISHVTDIPETFENEPAGTRAASLFATNLPSATLDILGRCTGNTACEPGMEDLPGLPATLHLINGPILNRRLSNPAGRLQKMLAEGSPPEQIIETFYVLAVSRLPSQEERAFLITEFEKCSTSEDTAQLAEDFVWSLLASREFFTRR